MVELSREESLGATRPIRHWSGDVQCSMGSLSPSRSMSLCLDDDVVFATDQGSKLDAAVTGKVVSIEADGVDKVYHTGWSVLVTGIAEVLSDPRATSNGCVNCHSRHGPQGPTPFLFECLQQAFRVAASHGDLDRIPGTGDDARP